MYGFLTVPETAKTGVCAHELGHLGKLASNQSLNALANQMKYLDGPTSMTLITPAQESATGASWPVVAGEAVVTGLCTLLHVGLDWKPH